MLLAFRKDLVLGLVDCELSECCSVSLSKILDSLGRRTLLDGETGVATRTFVGVL